MPPHTALILGAGPNIGAALATAFSARGYNIALASRTADAAADTPSRIHVKVDLSDPASVGPVFKHVAERLGEPSVVVYNAAAAGFTDRTDPLTPSRLPLSTYTRNLAINHTSVFAAAQAALASFATLDADASRTFIYTGNGLNSARTAMLGIVDCGVGKAASANLIMALAQAYGGRGYKFYYADERKPDGGYAIPVSGEAAAEFYPQLAEGKEQGEWEQTFVKGKGYAKF